MKASTGGWPRHHSQPSQAKGGCPSWHPLAMSGSSTGRSTASKLPPMPQGLKRIHGTGDLHFITFSCHHRLPYLASPEPKQIFEAVLEQTRQSHNVEVHGDVLMPEHVHLLLSEPTEADLATTLKVLNNKPPNSSNPPATLLAPALRRLGRLHRKEAPRKSFATSTATRSPEASPKPPRTAPGPAPHTTPPARPSPHPSPLTGLPQNTPEPLQLLPCTRLQIDRVLSHAAFHARSGSPSPSLAEPLSRGGATGSQRHEKVIDRGSTAFVNPQTPYLQ